ncbi:MAG: pyrophosphatase PpaX [Thermicanus sp.]|nr:pyrophosphatase PpaX [Thermicanus sp.]
MKYNTFLFDLDGTLLDTNELILQSFLYTLNRFYPGKYTREEILPVMGKPLLEQMRLFGPERAEELVRVYREYNLAMHDALIREFPHVSQTVKELFLRGAKLGVVTSKQRLTTLMGLRYFGLENYFSAIITMEDVKAHKPHPEPVLTALERLKAEKEEALMIGDSTFDLDAAHAAGVDAAAVAWSLKPLELLRSCNPEYILHDIRELLHLATPLMNQRVAWGDSGTAGV